jgi:protein TonB
MATAVTALPRAFQPHESLRRTLLISAGLHGLLVVAIIVYTLFRWHHGPGWGSSQVGDSARVNAVSSLPGIPLPAPKLATRNTVATENLGLHQTEPEKITPPPDATPIPKFKSEVKPEVLKGVNKRIRKEELQDAPNAVPYGLGGRPSQSYTEFRNGAGEGGIGFGEADFGERYAWYVAALRNRISSNWLQSLISPNLTAAPRVYVTFDILRNGIITNVQITGSSGIPEVDRSALRAIQASNPVSALPADYSGDRVGVKFFFDFRR